MGGQHGANGGRGVGGWLPDQDALEGWLEKLAQQVEAKPNDAPLHPAVEGLRGLIDRDPVVRLYFSQMIEQVPDVERYSRPYVDSVDHLLRMIDAVIGRAPEYSDAGMVGVPLNAVLDACMRTPAGFAAFRHDAVNAAFRTILRAWCDFLGSPDSRDVLNDSPEGWKCAAARTSTQIEQFQYDPGDPHWGFASWNAFFTRRFKPGQRPVAEPDDDRVIVSACESTPYAISTHAKRYDRFWIKAQPYSLHDMLAGDECVEQFDGGTVYQAYLDAHNYHRWHSPVAGTVRKTFVREGTYYSEADPAGEDPSQGYLAHVAARAVILIEADHPAVGLMAVVLIGMGEVSSCVIRPELRPGRRLQKGEEIGYFQYGGSSHCLVFRPGAVREFALGAIPDPHTGSAPLVRVGARLATAGG